MKPKIINSKVSHNDVKVYEGVRIQDSIVLNNCIIGDFSRITNSILNGYNRIDRNTLIYHSKLDYASYIGNNSMVMHSEIGKFCSLSWGITIGPANHDYTRLTTHDFLYNQFYDLNPTNDAAYDRFKNKTIVENDVWIGTGAVVLNGVKIGNGSVIGANAVVTKDIEPYAIAVGNPAKIIKMRFQDDIINNLLELKWWELPQEIIRNNFTLFSSNDIENTIEKLNLIKNNL